MLADEHCNKKHYWPQLSFLPLFPAPNPLSPERPERRHVLQLILWKKKIMFFSINPALSPVSLKMLGCVCTLLQWGGTSNFFQSVVKDLRAQRWMEILKPLQQDLLRCQQLPVQTQVSPDCLIELNCSGGNYKRIWICHWLFWKLWLWKNMLF